MKNPSSPRKKNYKIAEKYCSIKKLFVTLQPQTAKSPRDGAIAQLVEQRTENPCVPGSIPGGTTRKPRQ